MSFLASVNILWSFLHLVHFLVWIDVVSFSILASHYCSMEYCQKSVQTAFTERCNFFQFSLLYWLSFFVNKFLIDWDSWLTKLVQMPVICKPLSSSVALGCTLNIVRHVIHIELGMMHSWPWLSYWVLIVTGWGHWMFIVLWFVSAHL